ncbi:MAG: hypothetical protein J0L52_01740 [Caulobacterales bacterium]|nr:hypothetical protein [Caulobacterales bacterium]
MAGPVHYEVFARKTATAGWTLQTAVESRDQALKLADDLLGDKRAVSVRVTKETLDVTTMEFQSLTIATRGAPEPPRPKSVRDDRALLACTVPADLYAPHARDTISRVLDDWLTRQEVTPFELLHRPDLVELLDASGLALQHAVQKVAVPESQATGQPVHEIIRHYQRLIEQTIDRLVRAGRGQRFADLSTQPIADVARRLAGDPERAFLLGGAVAAAMAQVSGWRAKFDLLMDLADTAPDDVPAAALVHVVIEQAVGEIFALRQARVAVLGPELDLGGQMAALVRLAAPTETAVVAQTDARVAAVVPDLSGPAIRLGRHMARGQYRLLAAALSRRVLRELMGPRRLRPSSPTGEIDVLRAMAMILTAAAGKFLTLEEAQLAFAERSKTLVAADFVEAYVGPASDPMAEAELLVRLCENVTGAGAKRQASRWLVACVTALRFERSLRDSELGAGARLRSLAEFQARVRGCGLSDKDQSEVFDILARIGDTIEAEGRVSAQIARASAPLLHRLSLLLQMAAGDACPGGPAADRARAEALRLLRSPQTRQALACDPAALPTLRPLIQAAGLAA